MFPEGDAKALEIDIDDNSDSVFSLGCEGFQGSIGLLLPVGVEGLSEHFIEEFGR